MEWRGGMVPHIEFSNTKKAEEKIKTYNRPPLRKITQNWEQFRGSTKNGHVQKQALNIAWKEIPETRWSTKCGPGHSSIITFETQIITLEQDGEEEILIARKLEDGSEIWRLAEKTKWYDMMSGEGPRSTPTLHEGKLYALFSNGVLTCADANTGKPIWKIQTTGKDYEFPEWGISGSPLIWNDLIILCLGGENSAVKAYSKVSGEMIWKSKLHGKGVYLSPEILPLLGENHLIVALEGKIAGLNPLDGDTLWEKPWKIFLNNAQIVQPIAVSSDSFLMAAGYGKGAECLKIAKKGSKNYQLSTVWKSKDLKAKFSNPILKDGYIFGLSENLLVCIEAKTGKLMWRGKKYSYGRILLADQKLLILGHSGILSVVEANPKQFNEIFSHQLLNDARCWNGPAFVNGYLLARNGEQIACFDWVKN